MTGVMNKNYVNPDKVRIEKLKERLFDAELKVISLVKENKELESNFQKIKKFVDHQAEDGGLWGEALYASEAYVQSGLRDLHGFIEGIDKILNKAGE